MEIRIANRVRDLREGQGLTQAALARLARTSRSQVANVERGERAATVSTLEAFARALGVRLVDLLDAEEIVLRNPPDRAQKIAATLRDRGPDYMRAVEGLIVSLDRVAKTAQTEGDR